MSNFVKQFIKLLPLKFKHRFTLYHIRSGGIWNSWLHKHLSPDRNYLSHCSCGWHAWWIRKSKINSFFRWLVKCSWRGCIWDEWDDTQVGSIWQDEEGKYHSAIDEGPEEEVWVIGRTRQCERCWRCQSDRPVASV